MPTSVHLILLAILILGASLWIGGMAAVTILSLTSRRVLTPADRTRLFHAFGRRYFPIAGTALAVATACGFALLISRGWDGLATSICIVIAVLVVTLLIGVRQAKGMRRLRAAAANDPDDNAAQRSVIAKGRWAAATRALLGVLSLVVFVLAISTAG